MNRIAYMPLNTNPEAVTDEAVRAAVGFAAPLGVALHVTTFAVNIPQPASALGGLVLDIPGMVRVAEERSQADCRRLGDVAREAGKSTGLTVSAEGVSTPISLSKYLPQLQMQTSKNLRFGLTPIVMCLKLIRRSESHIFSRRCVRRLVKA